MKLLMAGSRGQGKDLISGFFLDNYFTEVVVFDDLNVEENDHLFNEYKILHTLEEAAYFFKNSSPHFVIGIASPQKRKEVCEKLTAIGGKNISFLSPKALIYDHAGISEEGVIIQISCIISAGVKINRGVLINVKTVVASDVFIDEYTSISPNVLIQEGVKIGKNCIISTGVTILPKVKIGDNVKIWMNKVIDQDIPSNTNYI